MRILARIFILSIGLLTITGFSSRAIGQSVSSQQDSIKLKTFSEGNGSPLIMLGGGTFGAAAFAAHAQILAKQFRVVRLQTLNVEKSHNKEPLPIGYSVKLESSAMARSLEHLGITAPVD